MNRALFSADSGTYESEALHAFSGVNGFEAVGNAFVETGVGLSSTVIRTRKKKISTKRRKLLLTVAVRSAYLHAALNDIKRADSGVGETASEDTANHAFGVVGSVVNVTHCVCGSFI